ncbi:MAG: hypothetical protein EZS28_046132, partial [Streblomastix strix]
FKGCLYGRGLNDEDEYQDRQNQERNDAIKRIGLKRDDESDSQYDTRIKDEIKKMKKEIFEKEFPNIRRDNETVDGYKQRRKKEKQENIEKQGFGNGRGEDETKYEYEERIDNEIKQALQTIGNKRNDETDEIYEQRMKEEIDLMRKTEYLRKIRGIGKQKNETNHEYKNRKKHERFETMKKLRLTDYKGDDEDDEQHIDRLERERFETGYRISQKLDSETDQEFENRIQKEIIKARKEKYYLIHPEARLPKETAGEYNSRRKRAKNEIKERNGFSDERGELEKQDEYNQRQLNERKDAVSKIGSKTPNEDEDEYENKIKKQISEDRYNKWDKIRKSGKAIAENENIDEYKQRINQKKQKAINDANQDQLINQNDTQSQINEKLEPILQKGMKENRRRQRRAYEGDYYDGHSEISYDVDYYARDERDYEERKKDRKRVVGIWKKPIET